MVENVPQQPVGAHVPELDVPGLIRRVRRICDFNQRELAARLGVSQSTVARWETGDDEPPISVFARLVALAGLSLAVVNESGAAARPMRSDGVRDAAGRRRPAHLDIVPEPPEAFCWGRPVRDRRARGRCRSDYGIPQPRVVADDHPSEEDVAAFVAEWRRRRKEKTQRVHERILAAPVARDPSCHDPCNCVDGCFEVPGCLTTCECRCEGAVFEPGGTEPVEWLDDTAAARPGATASHQVW